MPKINYEIDFKLNQNKLIVTVNNLDSNWMIRGYYLYKDGIIYKKVVKDNMENNYEFTIEEDGLYFVKVFVKKEEQMENKNSIVLAYFKEETKKQFESFLHNDNQEYKKIDLYKVNKPFEEFAFIMTDKKIDTIDLLKNLPTRFFIKEYSKKEQKNKLIISTNRIKNNSLIFSGYGKFDNNFVVGNKEANKNKNLSEVYEGIGNFTFLNKVNDKVVIGKDFFSLGRIFYYTDSKYTIISNEYHLLLILMKELNIEMNLDEEIVISNLAFSKGLLYEQHLSRKMDIKGVEQLAIEKYILIENDEIKLMDTSMVRLLASEFEITSYEQLLKEAAQEIKNNIDIIYNSKKFKNVIVDVTGGLDSRIVFSAVTDMDNEKGKFKLHTFDDKRTNDIKVAIPLSNLYDYPFETVPVKIELQDIAKEEEFSRSINMGVYFYRDFYNGKVSSRKTIRLLGGGGEAIARPYYTRYLQNDDLKQIDNEKEFVKELINRKLENALLPYKNGIEHCIESFSKELEFTIGNTVFQKYEHTYDFLRCGPHFSHQRTITKGFLEWNPIFSKKLYFLKIKTFDIFKNSKLAFDLIKYFNENLVGLPYEKEINNTEYNQIKNDLIKESNNKKQESINWNIDTSKWEKANKIKNNVTKYVKNKKIEGSREYYYTGIEKAFKFIMNNCSNSLKEVLGLPIYHWIKNNKDSENDLKTIFNKMYSLADQIRIMNDSRNTKKDYKK